MSRISKNHLFIAFLLLLSGSILVIIHSALAGEKPTTIEWSALVPEGWFPQEIPIDHMLSSGEQSELAPATPVAPVVEELDGKFVKLPGYIVPLDFESTKVKEFLLVPFIGACIHVPPPPSNQVVYSQSKKAIRVDDMWDPVWITGIIKTTEFSSDLADAGYTMQVSKVEPYKF